jgi:hypothetical protein
MTKKKQTKKTKRARSILRRTNTGNISERQDVIDEDSSQQNDLPVIDPT